MEFALEAATPELISEITPLLFSHHEEIEHYKDIPLEPDFEAYVVSQRSGRLRIFTCRRDGVLCGYSVFFVLRALHSKNSIQAIQDLLFLEKGSRNQGLGKAFIQWCDERMKEEGVQVVYQHLKARHNHGPLLETIGYELMDLVYARRL